MQNSLQYANEQSLASLMQLEQLDTMNTINCHQVGEIVSFDTATQTAEVQIKMLKLYNGELKEYPLLVDCPCVVLGGSKGRITFPIAKGDSCLVLFNDKDMDNWFAGGQTMQPRTNRLHAFSDAIALVGIRNMQNKITDFLADGTEVKYGASTIKLQDNKVTITNGTSVIEMSSGTVTVTASNVVIDAPTTSITGEVSIAGAVSMASTVSMAGAVSMASNLSISGNLTVNNVDIGPNHTHSGVESGDDNTGGVVSQ